MNKLHTVVSAPCSAPVHAVPRAAAKARACSMLPSVLHRGVSAAFPCSPAQGGTARPHSLPATPCVLVSYRSAWVINPMHFMHSLCCTSPLKSQHLCFPFNLAVYLGCLNSNHQASQLKHGNSGMLNLKSVLPKPSISTAVWGLHCLKICVLAKPVKAQYTSFMGILLGHSTYRL